MALAYVTITPGTTTTAAGTTAILNKLAVTGSAADFTSENPTLAAGQVGRETDTALFKVGNGTTAWASLDYAGSIPAGGSAGQVLSKVSSTDFDADWTTPAGAGLGDVVGPASSTADTLARWDGTTGKLLKNGLAFIDDDTMATASATNIPSAESVKAYIDNTASLDNALDALPDGTIWTTHGGADETLVPAHRENIGNGAAQLNEGAFLPVEAEPAPTTISAATYTILASDFGKRLHFTHATPALTVGTNAAQSYPDGFYCLLTSVNSYTVTASSGVDLNGIDAEVLTGGARPGCGMLDRLAADDWNALGDLTA